LEHGEPVGVGLEELPQGCGHVHAEVVPDEHDPSAEPRARAEDQVAVVLPAEAFWFVRAAPMFANRVDTMPRTSTGA
jgi:hypothetical protein